LNIPINALQLISETIFVLTGNTQVSEMTVLMVTQIILSLVMLMLYLLFDAWAHPELILGVAKHRTSEVNDNLK